LSTVDESSDDQYRFVMPGPELSEKETGECLNLLRQGDHPPDYLVLSGSLPPGVPPEFMRDCSALAKELNTRLIVDTSGEPLKAAASEGVYLLKPNLRELGELSDGDISDEAGQENAIRGLVDRGACEIAILSLGAAGVVVAQKGDLQRFRAPTVPIVSRVGAGDSMVAGIVTGFCRGYEIRDAILLGIAAGSAAVMTPGTQLCRKEDTERLWNEMRPK
jgi:6-phosphofructokinase 2